MIGHDYTRHKLAIIKSKCLKIYTGSGSYTSPVGGSSLNNRKRVRRALRNEYGSIKIRG